MSAQDYLVLVGARDAIEPVLGPARRRLAAAGWRRRASRPFLECWTPADGRLEVVEAFDGHGAFIGEAFDAAGCAPLDRASRRAWASRALDGPGARRLMREVWGRYVVIRNAAAGPTAWRDPSGAVECVGWRREGVGLFAGAPAAAFDALLPDDLEVDEARVRLMTDQPGEFRHALALTGLEPVAPGGRLTLGREGASHDQAWRPAEVYRRRGPPPAPEQMREGVVAVVRALAGSDRSWIAELSGGLDSAVVAAALSPGQRGRVRQWVNHHVADPEGDERVYAGAVAGRLGIALTEAAREAIPLTEPLFARAAAGFRPSLNDLDPGYNDDIAGRVAGEDAWGSLTGQGGDAVFFQMGTPHIGVDELFERGLRARPAVLGRVARWTRRSAWPSTWISAWRDHRRERRAWDHPWLEDLRGVPPAKARQINALAYCQAFQAEAVRGRRGPVVHPLLSQPLMELGLGMSAVDLTWGGRDRAALRRAFAADLPEILIARRSKGEVGAFYGRMVADSLPFLREYLLGGALAGAGLLDRARWEARLDADDLLWRGGYGVILSLALTEAWYRCWRSRTGRRRPSGDGRTRRSSGRTSP